MIFTDPSPDSEYENVLQPDIHLMTKHNYGRATGRSRKPTCELLKCQHAHSPRVVTSENKIVPHTT